MILYTYHCWHIFTVIYFIWKWRFTKIYEMGIRTWSAEAYEVCKQFCHTATNNLVNRDELTARQQMDYLC